MQYVSLCVLCQHFYGFSVFCVLLIDRDSFLLMAQGVDGSLISTGLVFLTVTLVYFDGDAAFEFHVGCSDRIFCLKAWYL